MSVRVLWIMITVVLLRVDKTCSCNIRRCSFMNNILSVQFGPLGSIEYTQIWGAPQRQPASLSQSIGSNKPGEKEIPGIKKLDNRWPYRTVKYNHPIQSPVDIITSRAVTMDLPTLTIGRPELKEIPASFQNSGHTVYIYINGDAGHKPYLTGGPLKNQFTFEQLHFHWGSHHLWGSEHFVDGESFSIEAHAVYFNQKYSNFKNAYTKGDGLAVLTILAKATGKINPLLEPIQKLFSNVTLAGSSVLLDSDKAMQWVASALPLNSEYYTYPGSLTTKPYTENVIFIILPKPITLSYSQLQAFRGIKNQRNVSIRENKRQLQPLHRRPIVRSTNLT